MKRAIVGGASLALLVCASIASAQEWMSWRSVPTQQAEPESAIHPAQEQAEATVPGPAPASAAPSASSQLQRGGSATDNGIIGNPTPALALYVAQVEFAHQSCGLEPTKQNNRFYEWAIRRGLMLDEYRRKDEDFSRAENVFLENFQESWLQQSEEKRAAFCSTYTDDVRWANDRNRLRILNVSDRFRAHFAPLSQERIDRARKASIFAGVLSLGFTAAGVNQARQHDFSTASQFNNYGAAFAYLVNDPSAVSQTPCESYLPFLLANVRPEKVNFDTYYSIKECSVQ